MIASLIWSLFKAILTDGVRYQMDILETTVVHHFDNHALAMRPVIMDDNARPHLTYVLMDFLQRNEITTNP